MSWHALLTAAGRGQRMGGPKALMLLPSGKPLAIAHAEAHLEAGAARVSIVVRERTRLALLAHLEVDRAELIVSEAPDDEGPAGSIREALRHQAAREARGGAPPSVWVVGGIDEPPALPSRLSALAEAARSAAVGLPIWQGRTGHPVALQAPALAPIARDRSLTLRDIVRAARAQDEVALVPWDRPMLSFNTPDEAKAILGDSVRFLSIDEPT